MQVEFGQAVLFLLIGIALIIVLTAKYRVHAFFALFLACLVTGLGVQISLPELLTIMKDGFGNILRSLGLIIVLGTTLGGLLEYTGCTRVMANRILKFVGEKNAAWAISITGFIVGMPIFCDSGYIVLSGLPKSLSKKTGGSLSFMSICLATGLYSVHCLVPPHPGVTAAAATIGVDIGKLMIFGIIIAIPSMIAGHYWAAWAGKKNKQEIIEEEEDQSTEKYPEPSALKAFLPVIVPILLIALRSIIELEFTSMSSWKTVFAVLGDPVIALSIGILLAIAAHPKWTQKSFAHRLQDSAEKAGGILVIIGAGGAFGAVLAATKMGDHFSQLESIRHWGILFPFVLTCILKTAQGSSTVAIITSASIILPLLPALGLDSDNGKLLAVLAMGSGSMMISHANDAYFWVITKFAGLEVKTVFKVYTVASLVMGVTGILMVYFLSLVLK